MSIKERIAALNLEEVHAPDPTARPAYSYEAVNGGRPKKPPPPPPTSRPAIRPRQTVNNPPILSNAGATEREIGNQPAPAAPSPRTSPALPPRPPPRTNTAPQPPPRTNTAPQQSPALPPRVPRRPSEQTVRRRESSDSVSTQASGISTLSIGSVKTNGTGHSTGSGGTIYQVRAPAYDPSKLPPLPQRGEENPKNKSSIIQAMKSSKNHVPSQALPPPLKAPEPQLPARPPLPSRVESNSPKLPQLPVRPASNATRAQNNGTPRIVAPPPRRSALELGFNNKAGTPPPLPQSRPSPTPSPGPTSDAPPPIPMSSRPNLDAIMASKPKPGAFGGCLKCRDFSGPDTHAARFPRTQLPSSDVGYLAHQLCSPFPSLTDKARAIFTWLHHNIDYDIHSFNNRHSTPLQPSTPEKTITSGLAVCEGYAGLFAALALKAGLSAVVISGDSKGAGHTPWMPGQPMPTFDSNHAWNAVQIDNGEWKLVEPTWGAGHVGCSIRNEGYIRSFNPTYFTMDNNEFGMKHYPSDNSQQYRTDGRILSFEEFKRDDYGGRVMAFKGCVTDHGLSERSIQPSQMQIKVHDPHGPSVIRFQFAAMCEHWDNARHGAGAPYVMLLNIGGRDGRKSDHIPFNTDNRVWWVDVPRVDLGAPGQKLNVYAVTVFNNKDARGLSYDTWKNKTAYSAQFGGVCMWELI